MLKRFGKLIAIFALTFAVIGGVNATAEIAQAAPVSAQQTDVNRHSPHFAQCDTDNTIFLSVFVALSSGNGDYFTGFAWSNNYYLNRVSVSWRQDSAHSWVVIGAAGGTSTSLNDVDPSSSGTYVPSNWPTHAPGDGGDIRISVWGGAGDSTDSCNSGALAV